MAWSVVPSTGRFAPCAQCSTSLDDLRALVADLGQFLQRLPDTCDDDVERTIASAVVQCELANDPRRPTVLALITDAPEGDDYRAACPTCHHLTPVDSGPLWWAVDLARQHALGTGHVVQLIAVNTEARA